MEKLGIVLSLEGSMAKVAVRRSSGCSGGCKTCGGCDTPNMIVSIPNEAGAKLGDTVELIANENRVVGAIAFLYIIPLVLFIAGVTFSFVVLSQNGVKNHELYSFLIGLGAMGLAYIVLKIFDKKIGNQDSHMMKMGRIINK